MDYYGSAIKARRTSWSETQGELAKVIGVSDAMISMIESGERKLSLNVALKIAAHYRITVEELLRTEPCDKYAHSTAILTKEKAGEILEVSFPIVSSDAANCNQDFKIAHTLHKGLFEDIQETGLAQVFQIKHCIELYEDAWWDAGVIEAAANMLGLLLVTGATMIDVDMEAAQKKLFLMNGVDSVALKRLYLRNKENVIDNTTKEEFVNDMWGTIVEFITALKGSEQWKALGDYYLAHCYCWGIVKGNLNPDEYVAMGHELMVMLKTLGNEYAREYLEIRIQ